MNGYWKNAALSSVVSYGKGKKPRILQDSPADGFVPYIDIAAFERGDIRQYAEARSSKLISKKDVLVVWDGARFGLIGMNQEGAAGSTLMVLTPQKVETNFLAHFIHSKFKEINANPKGTGIPHVNPEIFWNLEIPLPPLEEQRRIADKLDVLLAKVNKCKSRLERIPEILKRFRQSVLADACSGKLTEDWREENGAEEWQHGSLEEFCEITSGNAFKSADFVNSGIPVIKIANVQYGVFENDINQQYLPSTYAKEYGRFVVCENDILLALTRPVTNDTLKVCQYPVGRERALLNQRVAMLRPKGAMSREFLLLYMQCRSFKEEIKANLSETLQPNLSPKDLAKIEIACPSAEEQSEIVRQVGVFWTHAAKVEHRYSRAWPSIERLPQSILSKAFKGELVS